MWMRFVLVLVFCGAAALAAQTAFTEDKVEQTGHTIECSNKVDGDYCLHTRAVYGCSEGNPAILVACAEKHSCIEQKDVGKAACLPDNR